MISTSEELFGFSIARRSTRRVLVVAYYCAMAFGLYELLFNSDSKASGLGTYIVGIVVLINLPLCLGGVRRGGFVKPFRGVKWNPGEVQTLLHPSNRSGADAPLDERETGERDRMHFLAYTLTRWFALLLLAVYGLIAANYPAAHRQTGSVFLCLLTLSLWSLPQTIILWTEPDMEEPQ
jgi:hypothetical protein